ncbi:MAG TPA: four helix bundle protein [Bacteroidales bacterium]|nr:four helix bundle protein [Bacteroidales bacterium]HPS17106.1 four helix bundle protein [Bacteroidales bacterium]
MTPDELKDRTKKFALSILELVKKLPNNRTGWIITDQLSRAATSVGANYRASCRARSKADFISKITLVEEEADESCFWLEIIIEGKLIPEKEVLYLLSEARELTAIFTAVGHTSKIKYSKN